MSQPTSNGGSNSAADEFLSYFSTDTLRSAGQAGLKASYNAASVAIDHMPTEQLVKLTKAGATASMTALGNAALSTEIGKKVVATQFITDPISDATKQQTPNSPKTQARINEAYALGQKRENWAFPAAVADGRYSMGSQPIWSSPSFIDLFFDGVREPTAKKRPCASNAFASALEIVNNAFSNVISAAGSDWMGSMSHTEVVAFTLMLPALNEARGGSNNVHGLAHSKSEQKVYEAICDVHSRLKSLSVGQFMIVPAGWAGADPATKKSTNKSGAEGGHNVLLLVQRQSSSFSLCVCNTGDGIEYHPQTALNSPDLLYKLVVVVDDIPLQRLLDSTWWLVVFRNIAYPSEQSSAQFFYETMLPALNQRPVTAIMHENTQSERQTNQDYNAQSQPYAPYQIPPRSADISLIHCLMAACHFMLRRKGFSAEKTGLLNLLLRWQLCKMMVFDLDSVKAISSSEVRSVQIVCQQVAAYASREAMGESDYSKMTAAALQASHSSDDHASNGTSTNPFDSPAAATTRNASQGGITSDQLKQCQEFIEGVHRKLAGIPRRTIMTSTMPQHLQLPTDFSVTYQTMPMFERFVRGDDDAIEALAGSGDDLPQFRPIQFTLIPERCKTLEDVSRALRHCDLICTLLSYQTDTIKNTYMLRIALIQHLFTIVIPIPLPYDHKQKQTHCLWAQPMRYEMQLDLLRLLRLIGRHYTACAMSLRVTRSFDAARILTMSAIATCADALMRIKASDIPSMFVLHFIGEAPATPVFEQHPFGVDMGPFEKQSEFMKFTEPALITTRTRVLDYFHSQKSYIREDHLLFRFEQTMDVGVGATQLLTQLCWEIGFPPQQYGKYVTGEHREIILNYPELSYYRDIIFTFKFMMTPTSSALPPVKTWNQNDADLTWRMNASTQQLEVVAFGQVLQCAPPIDADTMRKQREASQRTFLTRLWGWFSYKDARAGPSGADPSALAGSFIEGEEDILHIKELPTFSNRLSQSSCELLITYLTAPYLRIPLILNFFASPEHINALGISQLQTVMDGALFEPSLWQPPNVTKTAPEVVPTPDRSLFATPSGLLFNELQKSPEGILRALHDLLEFAIELDTGKYTESTANIILYVVRFVVRVEAYMLYLIQHNTEYNSAVEDRQGTGWAGICRGLLTTQANVEMLQVKRLQFRGLMNDQIYPMLQRWCELAVRSNHMDSACTIHAHLAYLYFHTPASELNQAIVTTLLASQLFLTTRYRYDLSAENGAAEVKRSESMKDIEAGALGVPDTEMFDLFQAQRQPVLNYLQQNPAVTNVIMEEVVAIVTLTAQPDTTSAGQSTPQQALQQASASNVDSMDSHKLDTAMENAIQKHTLTTATNNTSTDMTSKMQNGDGSFKALSHSPSRSLSASTLVSPRSTITNQWIRYWRHMDGYACIGRYVPDMKLRSAAEQAEMEAKRHLMRGESIAETEINVQLGSLTLNTSRLESLDAKISAMSDFKQVFGGASSDKMQCAPVKVTSRRRWVRLVGTRHDVILWRPDDSERIPLLKQHSRRYDAQSLSPSEQWISRVLDRSSKAHSLLQNVELYLKPATYDDRFTYAHMLGYQVDRPEAVPKSNAKTDAGQPATREPPKWQESSFCANCKTTFTFTNRQHHCRKCGNAYCGTCSSKTASIPEYGIKDAVRVCDACHVSLAEYRSMKEVVVFRHHETVHIYNVIEHGRRFYRQLVWSSDSRWTLHDMPPIYSVDDEWDCLDRYGSGYGKAHAKPSYPHHSLILTRNLGTSANDLQTYVPTRFLCGLVPDALLDAYVFWQQSNDNIIGYLRAEVAEQTQCNYILHIELVRQSEDADSAVVSARIIRRKATLENVELTNATGNNEHEHADAMILHNLLYAAENSPLGSLAEFLLPLDDISYCLVWSKYTGRVYDPAHGRVQYNDANQLVDGDVIPVDLIELPRLQLNFSRRVDIDGVTRFYSHEHYNYFISNNRAPMLRHMIEGLTHAIVLESLDGDLGMLVPALPIYRLRHSTEPWSAELYIQRRDEKWWDACKIRSFFYPVHLSHTFLFTPTLASALYLLILRLLCRQYDYVFRIVDSCVADSGLGNEEKQIFGLLESVKDDVHPDAHACKLKLHLVMSDSNMPSPPWDLGVETAAYLRKRHLVSASCRLSIQEEYHLLRTFVSTDDQLYSTQLLNREQWLAACIQGQTTAPFIPSPSAVIDKQYDTILDESCLTQNHGLLEKMKVTLYKKPKSEQRGIESVQQMMKWLDHGLRIRGGKDELGFPFFYELMTGTLKFKILDSDNTYHMACTLLRLVSPSDWSSAGPLISILRCLQRNPSLLQDPQLPKLEERSSWSLFKGSEGALPRLLASFHTFIVNKRDKLEFVSPDSHRQPEPVATVTVPSIHNLPRNLVTPRNTDLSNTNFVITLPPTSNEKLQQRLKNLQSFAAQPLSVIGLNDYVEKRSREARQIPEVSNEFPFRLQKHPAYSTSIARAIYERLAVDLGEYAKQQNNGTLTQLLQFFADDVEKYSSDSQAASAAIQQLDKLSAVLTELHMRDTAYTRQLVINTLRAVSGTVGNTLSGDTQDEQQLKARYAWSLARYSGQESTLWFEYLVALLLSSTAELDLQLLNPLLSNNAIRQVLEVVAECLLHNNRIGQVRRCLAQVREVKQSLQETMEHQATSKASADLNSQVQSTVIKADKLAALLATKRHYVTLDESSIQFDPRYLVFEFTYNILLRQSQIELVEKLVMNSQTQPRTSSCHQMIMGAGKTTVVGPLLCLMLANGQQLVTQVVPSALLEFSRSVLREKFSAVVRKSIYTFEFDRFHTITPELYLKLEKCMRSRGVLISTATAIKAFQLKFIELLHLLDQNQTSERIISSEYSTRRAKKFHTELEQTNVPLRQQVEICIRTFDLLKSGSLLLDEVDLLLHPLKSELNFPIGHKEPLDLTLGQKMKGLRWELVIHILDALFYASDHRVVSALAASKQAEALLQQLKDVINDGYSQRDLQRVPHLILLSRNYYHLKLKPLLAQWITLWLSGRQHSASNAASSLNDSQILTYLTIPKDIERDAAAADGNRGAAIARQRALKAGIQPDLLSDEILKLLNLSHDWLHSLLPFVLSKIHRVSFGVLTDAELTSAVKLDPRMPKSRKFTAVPFVGKDVPSTKSEFSHPDVVIGLSLLGYRYAGLRQSDFRTMITTLQQDMWQEVGPYSKRPSSQLFAQWVYKAGGRVRGSVLEKEQLSRRKKQRRDELEQQRQKQLSRMQQEQSLFILPVEEDVVATHKKTPSTEQPQRKALSDITNTVTPRDTGKQSLRSHVSSTDIWPLRLLDLGDPDSFTVIYNLLHRVPEVIYHYLRTFVFPETLRHHSMKVSASGQELGGNMLFDYRIGFSGTPSDLIPVELGKCQYERASDGQMISLLTSSQVVDVSLVPSKWSVHSLLLQIATTEAPAYNALIDTGALITGMSNLDVAKFLLDHGLSQMQGVVFLDEQDRKMVLLRENRAVVPIDQAGLREHERFSFYDQIHTTGMDIPQAVNALACVTLGKDMVWRDYAQGTYRMRGIATGQTIRVMVIPEVAKLITTHMALAGLEVAEPFAKTTATVLQNKSTDDVVASDVTAATRISGSDLQIALRNIVAWLVINSMRTERVQFNMLCQQNLCNLWRKQSFNLMKTQSTNMGTEKATAQLLAALDLWRERMDFAVENSVPSLIVFTDKLKHLIQQHEQYLQSDADRQVVKHVVAEVDESKESTAEPTPSPASSKGNADDDESDPASVEATRALAGEQQQEQEQEQTQEKEQMQEQQVEVQQMPDEDVVGKKKYTTKKQELSPWPVAALAKPREQLKQFYPLSEFAVYKDSFFYDAGKPLNYAAPYLLASENYFHPMYTLTSYRRLKNVIVILEWIPDTRQLQLASPLPDKELPPVTGDTNARIRRAFDFLNINRTGQLSVSEFREAMRVTDVPVDDLFTSTSEIKSLMRELTNNHVNSPVITLTEWQAIVKQQKYHQIEKQRYYVVVSIEEAETLRGLIHLAQDTGDDAAADKHIIKGTFGSIALRVGHTLLDQSEGYTTAPHSQQLTSEATYRYFDSHLYYTDEDTGHLLRCIQSNLPKRRQAYFEEVKSCRRRAAKDWRSTSIAPALLLSDYSALVEFRALISAVRVLLAQKGMKPLDAFRLFDYNKDGRLSCSEMYGGLDWLGLSVDAEDIYAVVQHVDKTGEGYVLYEHWAAALTVDDSDLEDALQLQQQAQQAATLFDGANGESQSWSNVTVLPKKIKELYSVAQDKDEVAHVEEIDQATLMKLTVKVTRVNHWEPVWTSKTSLSRKEASVWEASFGGSVLTGKNRVRVQLGHYAVPSLPKGGYPPSTLAGSTIEITDNTVSTLTRSNNLVPAKLNFIMPHPINYKLVWSQSEAAAEKSKQAVTGQGLYCWRPVPPNPNYVCVGMIATPTPEPPSLTAMRCVPRGWCRPNRGMPVNIWDDSGTGGKRGSFWIMNQLHTLYVNDKYEQPEGEYYDIAHTNFLASDGLLQAVQGFKAAGGKHAVVSSQPQQPDLLSEPGQNSKIGAKSGSTLPDARNTQPRAAVSTSSGTAMFAPSGRANGHASRPSVPEVDLLSDMPVATSNAATTNGNTDLFASPAPSPSNGTSITPSSSSGSISEQRSRSVFFSAPVTQPAAMRPPSSKKAPAAAKPLTAEDMAFAASLTSAGDADAGAVEEDFLPTQSARNKAQAMPAPKPQPQKLTPLAPPPQANARSNSQVKSVDESLPDTDPFDLLTSASSRPTANSKPQSAVSPARRQASIATLLDQDEDGDDDGFDSFTSASTAAKPAATSKPAAQTSTNTSTDDDFDLFASFTSAAASGKAKAVDPLSGVPKPASKASTPQKARPAAAAAPAAKPAPKSVTKPKPTTNPLFDDDEEEEFGLFAAAKKK